MAFSLLQGVREITIPLQWEVWAGELKSYPDREYAQHIVSVIQDGFWRDSLVSEVLPRIIPEWNQLPPSLV